MKIIITGATGFIGKKITSKLIERKEEVIVFTRSLEKAKKIIPHADKYVFWSENLEEWQNEMNNVDAVIHLAGENVMERRWTEKHKKKVLESRIQSTKNLVSAIGKAEVKPKIFLCASAIGFYGNITDRVDEYSLHGNDFLANVVFNWEEATAEVQNYSVRRVSIRIGIVLDKDSSALKPFINTHKFFVGGPIGNGKQWLSWIHADDVVNIFLFALDNSIIDGIVNAVAPGPVSMNEFAKTLGRRMKRPSFLRVPSFALKLFLGEGANTVLNGAYVQSDKIINLGYNFRYSNLDDALKNILSK